MQQDEGGGYQPLVDFLKELSQDPDVQTARRKVQEAIESANIDPEHKELIRKGDVDAIRAAIVREESEGDQFVLFFL
jgi:hypothetical protein